MCFACSSLCCLDVFGIGYFPIDKVFPSHTFILGLINVYVSLFCGCLCTFCVYIQMHTRLCKCFFEYVFVCVCVLAAVSKYASVRCAQKSSAMARYCQHQSHRRSRPPAYGYQWPERPLCQIQDGAPEVQEQGKHTLFDNVFLS